MMLYVWRNSGFKVWLTDRLVTAAGLLNPATPWKNIPLRVVKSVNDATMDDIRAKYEVLDRIIKQPQYDGSALKDEAWQAFKEIRELRQSVLQLQQPVKNLHREGVRTLR